MTYTIEQDMHRMLLPQIVQTGLLCVLFFGAVKINLYLLVRYRIIQPLPVFVDILVLSAIFLLFCIQIVVTYTRTMRTTYTFFPDHIEGGGRWRLPYARIRSVSVSQDKFDRLFHTGTVRLGDVSMKHVAHPKEMAAYVRRLCGLTGYYR